MSIGLKLAGVEHRWERRTNYAILIGIICTGLFYYYKISFFLPYIKIDVSTAEIGLFFLILIGVVHLIARLGHKGEQYFMKKDRPWRK